MAAGCLGRGIPAYGPPGDHPHAHLWDITSTEFGYEVTYGGGSSVYGGPSPANLMWEGPSGGPPSLASHYPTHDAFAVAAAAALPLHELWQANPFRNQCMAGHRYGGSAVVSSSKKPRRRVPTIAQRRAANIRERRRMFNLNESFDKLRRKVPTFAYEKRLSRIETLRLAITYISFMTELLASDNENASSTVTSSSMASSGGSRIRPPSNSVSSTTSPLAVSMQQSGSSVKEYNDVHHSESSKHCTNAIFPPGISSSIAIN